MGNTAHVHQDDLRKLTEEIRTQVDFEAVIEKLDIFENSLLDKLLDRWKQTESSKVFGVVLQKMIENIKILLMD